MDAKRKLHLHPSISDMMDEKKTLMNELKQIRQTLAVMERESPLSSIGTRPTAKQRGHISTIPETHTTNPYHQQPSTSQKFTGITLSERGKEIPGQPDFHACVNHGDHAPSKEILIRNYGSKCVVMSRESYDFLQNQLRELQSQIKRLESERCDMDILRLSLESQIETYKNQQHLLETQLSIFRAESDKRREDEKSSVPLSEHQKLVAELDPLRRFYDRYKTTVQNIESITSPEQVCIVTYKGCVMTSLPTLRDELRGIIRQQGASRSMPDTFDLSLPSDASPS